MRKLVVVATVWTVVVFVVGRISVQVPANAEGQGQQGAGAGTPKGNGDVNGDGTIDISDGVYILNWLFLGGKALVAIECPLPDGKGLPATGQTRCYNEKHEEISCDSADFPGQDGYYKIGCPMVGRFIDNGDGTVTDRCTGLMWQKETADTNRDGNNDELDRAFWRDALQFAHDLGLGGYHDWRLPNIRELLSLVDYSSQSGCPAIDSVFFPTLQYASYWSSTTISPILVAQYPGMAWCVEFYAGRVGQCITGVGPGGLEGEFVRAVRGGL